jgi:HSP90 family molecular chaperone
MTIDMDDCGEFILGWLSFARDVFYSEDSPLNLSRETLHRARSFA